jgi:response regulator RpfG family c-di-GMP phosphodiesterase
MMPGMDGVEIVRRFREKNTFTPVVMITAAGDDRAIKMNALQSGCTDFLAKPLDPLEFQVRTMNLLRLKEYQNLINDRAALLEHEVKLATEEVVMRERETLLLLGRASETKDPETGAHIERVAHYSRLIAQDLGLPSEECERIYFTAPLHDIGKVGIPDAILLKPGRLDDAEFAKMKEHTIIGGKILENCRSEYLQTGREIALSHHERYDGAGYPYRLAGESIPLHGRIVAATDVFDALVSVRPYKAAWSVDDAFALLRKEAGSHFDPAVIDAFIKNRAHVEELHLTIVDR